MKKDNVLLAESYQQIRNTNVLAALLKNDCQSRLNEGLGDDIKTKLVQPAVTYLLNKLKEIDPDTYNKVSQAIQSKDTNTLNSLFNSPEVTQEQNAITQQVTHECLTMVSEEEQKPSLVNSVWTWIKGHPRLTTAGVLAALGVLGLATFGAGGVVPLLTAMGTHALSGAAAGGIGGAAVGGVKSAVGQIANQGKVNVGQTLKDTAVGGLKGAAMGAVGGALGQVGQQAAVGLGAAAGDITSVIKNLMMGGNSEKLLAAAAANPDLNPNMKTYVNALAQKVSKGEVSKQDLDNIQSVLKNLTQGQGPAAGQDFNAIKDSIMTVIGTGTGTNSASTKMGNTLNQLTQKYGGK